MPATLNTQAVQRVRGTVPSGDLKAAAELISMVDFSLHLLILRQEPFPGSQVTALAPNVPTVLFIYFLSDISVWEISSSLPFQVAVSVSGHLFSAFRNSSLFGAAGGILSCTLQVSKITCKITCKI